MKGKDFRREEGETQIESSRLRKKSLHVEGVASARLKPLLILRHLRRGSKPRPFKTGSQAEFFRSLLRQSHNARMDWRQVRFSRTLFRPPR